MTEANARVIVQFRSGREATAAAEALRPEAAHPAGRKGRATISIKEKQLIVRLEARDSRALRAIMTSYLRMLAAVLNVLNALERPQASRKQAKH